MNVALIITFGAILVCGDTRTGPLSTLPKIQISSLAIKKEQVESIIGTPDFCQFEIDKSTLRISTAYSFYLRPHLAIVLVYDHRSATLSGIRFLKRN
jgi:hypothetical protein